MPYLSLGNRKKNNQKWKNFYTYFFIDVKLIEHYKESTALKIRPVIPESKMDVTVIFKSLGLKLI